MPRIKFGDFRRTYANLLASNGVSYVTIQKLLRLTSINLLLQYLSPTARLREEKIEKEENDKTLNKDEKEE